MPTGKTRASAKKRAHATGRPRLAAGSSSSRAGELAHARVVREDGTTYVLVPEQEYERLIAMKTAREALAVLENPKTEWLDFDACKLQLAGSRIADARRAAKLTQTELARKLGIPQSQVSRIERHPERSTIRTLKRIAKALGVDVKLLIE